MLSEIFPKERLQEFYHDLTSEFSPGELEGYECLFMPHIGHGYKAAKQKIMFVGKDPNGHGEGNLLKLNQCIQQQSTADKLGKITERFVESDWANPGPGKHQSPFSQFLLTFTWGILNNLQDLPTLWSSKAHAEQVFDSIVWTNVLKTARRIGENDFVVDRKFEEFHIRRFKTLPDEIKILKPDLIIFTVPWSWEKTLQRIWPDMVSRPLLQGKDTAVLSGIYDKALVVRCRHPQGWPNAAKASFYREIVKRLRRT
ncbi:MAG TPA: hypothetical protein VLH15_00155 [Dehalococcoidales bacterium]|nr:hypothetical protein [Dehalococcoidales bacterium]